MSRLSTIDTTVSPRSGRQHTAWGEAQRTPQEQVIKKNHAREAADRRRPWQAVGRFADYASVPGVDDPGVPLRFTQGFTLSAAPQASSLSSSSSSPYI